MIPPAMARLWGREPTTRRGPRPSLETPAIVRTAIALADAGGLTAVRMSDVADRLGVAAMSLYRYVGSKDELLVLMADGALPDPPALTGEWRADLTSWTRAHRDVLVARPWLLEIRRFTPPTGPRSLRWLDRALAALGSTGLDTASKINIATNLTGYATSQAALTLSLTPGGDPDGALEGLADYGAVLTELADPGAYPALAEALREGAFGANPEWIDDADFTFGLDLLLRGIQDLIDG